MMTSHRDRLPCEINDLDELILCPLYYIFKKKRKKESYHWWWWGWIHVLLTSPQNMWFESVTTTPSQHHLGKMSVGNSNQFIFVYEMMDYIFCFFFNRRRRILCRASVNLNDFCRYVNMALLRACLLYRDLIII